MCGRKKEKWQGEYWSSNLRYIKSSAEGKLLFPSMSDGFIVISEFCLRSASVTLLN